MTVPEDLTARFSLHTKARIEAIEAEFPAQTTISRSASRCQATVSTKPSSDGSARTC